MHLIQPDLHTRRAFLRRSTQLGLAGTALPFALNLAAMGEAAAFTATDYKALVCVFLYGGNDYANTVVTYDDDSYNRYAAIRGGAGQAGGGIALAKAALANTVLTPAVPLAGGRQYALHPAMPGMAQLFNTGKAAVQLNVGPLVVPLTRAQYSSNNRALYPLPPKLFSHNDQQSVWQSAAAEGAVRGWGGAMGDLALAANGQSLFTCMSVTGNAVFLAGRDAVSYQIGPKGAIAINGVVTEPLYDSPACREALRTLITQSRPHVLENEYNRITTRSIDAQKTLTGALAGTPNFDAQLPDVDAASGQMRALNRQLKMVARLIAAGRGMGIKRQVFMVSLGGFDTHDNLKERHPALLRQVGDAMAGFQRSIDSMGMGAGVTTFTASEFGRTLSSNGDGSDHGWGAHHFVLGGAVKGGAYYGNAPQIALGGPEDTGQGRLLPTTSVDQFAATLGRWFGVSDTELALVAPNIANFSTRNLGFL